VALLRRDSAVVDLAAMCDPQDEDQEPVIAYLDVRDAKYFSWITSTTAEHHSALPSRPGS
jgi:hypothetical protein